MHEEIEVHKATLSWDVERGADRLKTPLHMCYHAKFGRFSLKSVVMVETLQN